MGVLRVTAHETNDTRGNDMRNASSVLAALTLAAALAVPGAVGAQTTPPQEYMDLARDIFSELIEINTTNSERGNNTIAARALARHLLDAGFPEEDVHVLVPDDAPTKGNLVVRYRGRDTGQKAVLLLAHIDVVEALPEPDAAEVAQAALFEHFEHGGVEE